MALSLLRSEARDFARLLVRDTSTTKPALTDAQYNTLIEDARQAYSTMHPDILSELTGSVNTANGSTQVAMTFATNAPRPIFDVYITETIYGGNTSYVGLARKTFAEIGDLQVSDQNRAKPTSYAAYFQQSNGSFQAAVFLHPVPDAVYTLLAFNAYELPAMSADTDELLFGQNGSRVIARMAAAEAALLAGRDPGQIESILRMVPERMQNRTLEKLILTPPRANETRGAGG